MSRVGDAHLRKLLSGQVGPASPRDHSRDQLGTEVCGGRQRGRGPGAGPEIADRCIADVVLPGGLFGCDLQPAAEERYVEDVAAIRRLLIGQQIEEEGREAVLD